MSSNSTLCQPKSFGKKGFVSALLPFGCGMFRKEGGFGKEAGRRVGGVREEVTLITYNFLLWSILR